MPGYARPAHLWLSDRLKGTMNDVSSLKKQGTEYIVNENLECVAIIGNIENAPLPGGIEAAGYEKTGLKGWGLAVKSEGKWQSLIASEADTGWVAAELKNGFTAYGGAQPVPAYRREENVVRFRGLFKPEGTNEAVAFTLPAAFAPPYELHFGIPVGVLANSAQVNVHTGGEVKIAYSGSCVWFGLDGISYTTD